VRTHSMIHYGDWESQLSEEGLGSFDALFDSEGILADRNRLRDVVRLTPIKSGDVPYLKRYYNSKIQKGRIRADDELKRINRFIHLGFPGPECAVMGWDDEKNRGAFLLLMAPQGVTSIDLLLKSASFHKKKSIIQELAKTLGHIHGAGIRIPDLMARHVIVKPGGKLYFIDLARLKFDCFSETRRLQDLASLSATIEYSTTTLPDRVRFIKHYMAAFKNSPMNKKNLFKEIRNIRGKEKGARSKKRYPATIQVVESKDRTGRAYHNTLFEADLKKLSMQAPSDFRNPGPSALLLRDIGVRRNYRIDNNDMTFFLKVHCGKKKHRAKRMGRREWNNHLLMNWIDIPAPAPVSWGQGAEFSFFVSESCGKTTLEDLADDLDKIKHGERSNVAKMLAFMVKRLHRFGFFHKDLYLCHIVYENITLFLIDLQRLVESPMFLNHRRKKDLAALLYSSFDTQISSSDKMRFFRTYCGSGRLSKNHKRLIRSVEAKALKIEARVEKKLKKMQEKKRKRKAEDGS